MAHATVARTATRDQDAVRYQRHRPEQTLLYHIVEQHYPVFALHMADQGRPLPDYVQREFEDYLKCGRLERGFLRVRCESCQAEHLVTFSCKRRGFCPSCGARRMAENAALLVDEVLPEQPIRQWVLSFPYPLRFLFAGRPVIMGQVLGIVYRVIASRFLERQGLLERDPENSYLAGDAVDDDPLNQLQRSSITYRIAVGPQAGRKVFTLQTLPACDEPFDGRAGKVAGFSLHAGVAASANERKKLERLCRYISRPAVSSSRLSLTPNGNIRYQLKTPYRESLPRERSECFGHGTTHVIFEPLDFIARLAALVPRPRVNLTRFHGVFAPNNKLRALVTPAKRGKGNQSRAADETQTPAERRAAMTWAQRLKRVFNIDTRG